MPDVTIICMKWGERYGAQDVNVLRNAVKANLSRPHRFVCLSDDRQGLADDVEVCPVPPLAPAWHQVFHNSAIPPAQRKLSLRRLVHGVWPKLALFQRQIHNLSGPALFLDLDVAILRPLDPLLENSAGLHSIRETPGAAHSNSSALFFELGSQAHIYETFMQNPAQVILNFRSEQRFSSSLARNLTFWPDEWFCFFRRDCMRPVPLNWLMPLREPPPQARLVIFHGEPNPADLLAGSKWGRGLRQSRQRVPWLETYWRKYGGSLK